MAGSVTITYVGFDTVKYVQWAWTSDASGDVSGTDTVALSGVPLRWVTNPGSTAPTDDYDITVLDDDGIDIANGGLADRDTSNTEHFIPGGNAAPGAAFMGLLSLVVANAGNAKEGTLRMYYR